MSDARLPDDIRPAFDSGMPSNVVTCSADGTPNCTTISKIYYVDDTHVALSFQFFNKTKRNVSENPRMAAQVYDLPSAVVWYLDLEFDHSETDGAIFDEMDMQIEAIASMTGMSGIFKLKAADIYRVTGVRKVSMKTA
jgi:hypothetical protein